MNRGTGTKEKQVSNLQLAHTKRGAAQRREPVGPVSDPHRRNCPRPPRRGLLQECGSGVQKNRETHSQIESAFSKPMESPRLRIRKTWEGQLGRPRAPGALGSVTVSFPVRLFAITAETRFGAS